MRAAALLLAAAWAAFALPAAASPALREVPRPALGNLEEADRLQLEEARAALDALLAGPEAPPERLARAFGEMGSLYLLYDLVGPAEAALANAAALAPEEFAWCYYLGVLHQREGRLEEAREHLARAAELRPEDLPTRLHLGQAELDADLLAEAAATFRAALTLDPESAAAHLGLGEIAHREGRLEEAIERYERALALQPRADSIHHRLGLAYRQAGELDRARDHLAKNRGEPVRFSDPLVDGLASLLQGPSIHFKRGNRAMAEGQVELAIEQYGKAAERAPDDPLIHYNLGAALTRAGRRDEAVERFRRAVELDPEYRDAHYNLATALGEAGRWGEAARHFERAWRIDPLDASARLDWALALEHAGDTAGALRELSGLVESLAGQATPLAGRAHAELGAALGRAGRLEEAAAQYGAAARLDPGDPGLRFGQAMALILAGRHREAREALEAALPEVGDELPLVHLLARLLATAPDPAVRDGARALELAGRVMEASPTRDHAETLAMALAEAGDFEGAAEWQRRVLRRAEEQGAPAPALAAIRARLARYERGEAERSPWEEP
jgi:superkiller protein 3